MHRVDTVISGKSVLDNKASFYVMVNTMATRYGSLFTFSTAGYAAVLLLTGYVDERLLAVVVRHWPCSVLSSGFVLREP